MMRKTMCRGKSTVRYQDLSFRAVQSEDGERRKRAVVTKADWERVVEAGFVLYPVGKLLERGTMRCRVEFCAPPVEAAERVRFHNALVDLCNIPLRKYVEMMHREAVRAGSEAAAAVAPEAGQ